MQKITANDGSSSDNFGYSLALSNTHLVVGAPYDDDLGANSGSVYVYSVASSRATLVQKVTANDGSSGEYFGKSVALSSTHLVVGAHDDDDLGSDSGSVYLYSVSDSGATLVQKVTANDGSAGDLFGYSVALSSTHLVVGAYGTDDLGSGSGSVYVYSVSDSGATFVQKVTANDGSSSGGFGQSVALSSTHLAVAAPYNLLGYLYSVTDSGATFLQKVTPNYRSNTEYFGWNAVALSSTHMVFGSFADDDVGYWSGSMYMYGVNDSGATFLQKVTAYDGSASDMFGYSVALSTTHLVVRACSSGSVYVYSVSDLGATFVQKVTANDGITSCGFGQSVALSSTHLVIGAPDDTSESVYLA
eukprot:gene16476-19557_t